MAIGDRWRILVPIVTGPSPIDTRNGGCSLLEGGHGPPFSFWALQKHAPQTLGFGGRRDRVRLARIVQRPGRPCTPPGRIGFRSLGTNDRKSACVLRCRRDFLKRSAAALSVPLLPLASTRVEAAPSSGSAIKVVVWDERQPVQKEAYPKFLGNAIADHLASNLGFR